MTDKEREELAEAIGKGLASGSKISAEDLQNENTISYKMGEIMEMDADFVTLLNFVDWYSPTKEVNEKLTKILRHIAGQTYQNQTEVKELKEKLNIRSCQNCRNYNKTCPNDGSCKHYSKWEGYENPQLTKAKEIIKTFLGFAETFGYSPSMDKFITEAEQFLNSEVEK